MGIGMGAFKNLKMTSLTVTPFSAKNRGTVTIKIVNLDKKKCL
jgi:hypothetical protein